MTAAQVTEKVGLWLSPNLPTPEREREVHATKVMHEAKSLSFPLFAGTDQCDTFSSHFVTAGQKLSC
jgi:hypothetical protein